MTRQRLAAVSILLVFLTGPVLADVQFQLPDHQPQLVLASADTNGATLSVDDLGFTKEDVENDLSQKELDTRSDMLRIHQTLGLITAVPMITQFVIGLSTSDSVAQGNKDTSLHTALGLTTFILYGTTAAFQIFAPKPKHKKQTGDTAIHEALSWIHIPLMVAVVLTGDMMNDRLAANQPLGNLGVVHGVMATTLLGTYLTSLTIMTF
jgi:cytochrome b561